MKKYFWALAFFAGALTACGKKEEMPVTAPVVALSAAEEKILNIYNWPDYIAKDMVANTAPGITMS